MLEPGGQTLSILDVAARAGVDALWVANILAGAMVGIRFGGPESPVVWASWTEGALRALADIDDLDVLRWDRGAHDYEVPISEIVEVTAHHEKVDAPDGQVLIDDLVITVEHVSGHFAEVRVGEACFRGLVARLRVQLGVSQSLLARVVGQEPGLSLVLWSASPVREAPGV